MKKNQPKINICRRGFLSQTALSVPFIMPSFVQASASLENKWQTLDVPIPETPIFFEDGTELYVKQFFGRQLLINFWATWCAPCISELPHLDKAAPLLKKFNIDLLLVSTDRAPIKDVGLFLDNKKINTPLRGFDPKAIWARAMNVTALPVTFLINSKQTSGLYHIGTADWSTSEMIQQIISQFDTLG